MIHLFGSFLIRYLIDQFAFDAIQKRVEISTPLNSWTNLRECLALIDYNIDPYESSSCHAPPFSIMLFSLLNAYSLLTVIFFWLCDLHCSILMSTSADNFLRIMFKVQQSEKKHYAEKVETLLISEADIPRIRHVVKLWISHLLTPATATIVYIFGSVFFSYLYNPFTILTCVGRTTTVYSNLLLSLSLFCISNRRFFIGAVFLAFATYFDMHHGVIILSVALLMTAKKTDFWMKYMKNLIVVFTIFFISLASLLLASRYVSDSWHFVHNTYIFKITIPVLTPDIGLFWYFFTETFDHFRPFFLSIFILNPFVFVIPLMCKLKHEPVFYLYLLMVIFTIFKPYPSIGDTAFYLNLLPMWKYLFKYVRHGLIIACAMAACSILAPVMWHLWIEIGSANANFYFAIVLIFSTAQIFLLTDLLYAHVRRKLHLKEGIEPFGNDGKVMLK